MSSVTPNSGECAVEEWLELESDPGVFSLLIEDYGVRGVKVEEVYDISKKFDSTVFGFVFLFRYELTDRRARKKARDMTDVDSYVLDDDVVSKMFFAHQIITNSCATHALLSVLLNCHDLDIGPNLTKLKDFTRGLDPESKGFAIANMMELAHIHNKHARPPRTMAPPIGGRKSSIVSSAFALLPDTYHYVSFVPINGRLFELDGLKEFPIDHGPWGDQEKWTDLFQRTVTQRLLESQDCLFNLMALIPDPVPQISECLKKLHEEQTLLLEATAKLAQQVKAKKEQEGKKSSDGPVAPVSVSAPVNEPVKLGGAEETEGDGQPRSAPEYPKTESTGQAADVDSKPDTDQVSSFGDTDSERTLTDKEQDTSLTDVDTDKSTKEETDQDNSLMKCPEEPKLLENTSPKEEPMECSEPVIPSDSVVSLVSAKEEPKERSEPAIPSDSVVSLVSAKEEPKERSEPAIPSDSVVSLVSEVSKALPTEASELDAIAGTPIDSSVSLDESLRIAVAKVVRNHKEAEEYKQKLKEEVETKQRFRVEHSRRIHDYDSLIFDFVKCLAQNKQLPERLLRRPSVAPPPKGGSGRKHKRKKAGVSRKPKTTLLLNGSEV